VSVLTTLWIPILATAVGIFIASSLIHMVFKWHMSDYRTLANEDAVRAAIKTGNPSPGLYVTPYCTDMKDMGSEPMMKKFSEGPNAYITVRPNGMPNMGAMLGQWFALTLVVAAAVAVITAGAVAPGAANASNAGCLAGMMTFLAYFVGSACNAVWMGKTWGSTAKDALDAAIYGAITWVIFMKLWH
jgi:hypothetical protein